MGTPIVSTPNLYSEPKLAQALLQCYNKCATSGSAAHPLQSNPIDSNRLFKLAAIMSEATVVVSKNAPIRTYQYQTKISQ